MDRLRSIFTVLLSIFIVIAGIVCIVGLSMSIYFFVCNQQMFTDACSELAKTIRLSPDEQETARVAIENLERLHKLQRNAASHDIMAFLFGVLSAALVGICAWLADKSSVSAKKAEEASRETSTRLQKSMDIADIHTEIIHARAALLSNDFINASERIVTLPEMVVKTSLSKDIDGSIISKLLQELEYLTTSVNEFKDRAMRLSAGTLQTTMLQAAINYEEWLAEAIKVCDELLR
jgi:flagellar basal body-associated protein FliL